LNLAINNFGKSKEYKTIQNNTKMPSKKERAKMKKAALVNEMKKLKSQQECEDMHKKIDKEYEESQMEALDTMLEKNPDIEDESGYKKYCMKIMIKTTNLLSKNFPKYNHMFNPRGDLPKELVDALDEGGCKAHGKTIKALGFWNIVNGDTKTIEYMYGSYDNGAIMPIGKKSQDFPMKMEL